jgi:hypothetical protein
MGRKTSREHERAKPRPRPERAITLTKKSVATSQLKTAIELWFMEADPISIFVLAFNAHEILNALGANIGKPSQLKTWLGTMPERFQKQWKYVWNFCKHGLKDVDDDVPHDPRHADFLITFAGQCYRDVFGRPTPLLFAFDLRFLLEHPECINLSAAGAAIRVPEFFETYRKAASQSRHEFLQTFLPLIEAGEVPLV